MILVTGAAGKTGTAVIQQLIKKGAVVRAWVRREAQAQTMRDLGVADVIVGDIGDTAVYHTATQNIRALYHICPNMHPNEVEIGHIAIAAAQANGVQHFVYHSVLHPQTERMPHHWHKLRVEEMLFESGLPVTILQPTAYMQNILGSWRTITEKGLFVVPYPVTTKLSLVDLDDVAKVAAMVLTETGHDGAIYELVGTEPLAQVAVAKGIGEIYGRSVQAQQIPITDWQQQAEAAGLSKYQITTLTKMFNYYADFGFAGSPNVLKFLLGRVPNSLMQFLENQV